MNTHATPQKQRREHTRIEDLLPLAWQRVESSRMAGILAFFKKNGVPPPQPADDVQQLLSTLDISSQLQKLEKDHPILAFILGRMDVKLNLLLQSSYSKQGEDRPLLPTRVSLGGGGIAFWGDHPELAVGDFLQMRLALAVGTLAIVEFFVRVVAINKLDSADLVRISCQFDPIADDVREQIIQHTFKRQAAMLRAKSRQMTTPKMA